MNKEAIVLLSGGMDSVVLAHYVAKVMKEEVLGVFFAYGQPQQLKELDAVQSCVADIPNAKYRVVQLPTTLGDPSGYVPMRNLIFISHAAAIAQREGIKKIYAGFIDPLKEDRYPDTTEKFVNAVDAMLKPFGIEFIAPFVNDTKVQVARYGRWLEADLKSTWSCNNPKSVLSKDYDRYELERCGECNNCKFYVELENNMNHLPILEWQANGRKPTDRFRELFRKRQIIEARLLINNVCNLQCKHCFYGFDKSKCAELTTFEWKETITECVENGITQFHFAGKEPLLGERIFDLVDYIRDTYPGIKYDVVTNGTTINQYMDKIKTAQFNRVCLSFDDFEENIRATEWTPVTSAKRLWLHNVPVTMFVDLTTKNIKKTVTNLRRIRHESGCNTFWIRPVYYYGHAENIEDILVEPQELYELYRELRDLDDFALKNSDITLRLKAGHLEGMLEYDDDGTLRNDVEYVLSTGDMSITKNLALSLEMYCGRYESQITITADGFVLGCATEVAQCEYDKQSMGNIQETDLAKIIRLGKEDTLKVIDRDLPCADEHGCDYCYGGCSHSKYCYKMGCKLP